MALGFQRGETVSILSNTVVEWVLSDLGVLSCGGVCSGIYPTDAASQVHYLCEDSRSVILFVEDDEQLDKALEVRAQLPLLRKIVVFDMEGLHDLKDEGVISLQALREGRADVCAIDSVCVGLARKHSPRDLDGLVEIARSPLVPALPYVTRAGDVAGLRAALNRVMAEPELAEVRAALLLKGVTVLPEAAYDAIPALEGAVSLKL